MVQPGGMVPPAGVPLPLPAVGPLQLQRPAGAVSPMMAVKPGPTWPETFSSSRFLVLQHQQAQSETAPGSGGQGYPRRGGGTAPGLAGLPRSRALAPQNDRVAAVVDPTWRQARSSRPTPGPHLLQR